MKIASLVFALTATLPGAAVFSAPAAAGTDGGHSTSVCLQPQFIRDTKIVSDTEILITMKNGQVWQNILPSRCPGLKFEDGFRWDIRGGEVCSNLQVISVLRRGNSCMLGAFTAYTPPDKPAPAP